MAHTSVRARVAAGSAALVFMALTVPRANAAAPPATPRAECGPGSRPEPDVQGRVPKAEVDAGRAQEGYRCNLEEVSRFGTRGGYKVHHYVDEAGHECAYYDSTLLFPGSVANGEDLTGVYVLDMADPATPVKTANLLTPAMQSPHESLELNARRGLLVSGMGYPTFNPGFVDIYDVSDDCRNPVLKSSTPLGVLGHESGFSPDGNTFWVSSTGGGTLTALDVTDPAAPRILWVSTDWAPHGVRVSADGNRLYIADLDAGLVILDVSQIQAREPEPEVALVSKLSWDEMSIPQVAIPVTINGQAYLIEIDEFSRGTSTAPDAPVGAARIIDISSETKPRVVSNIRLEVNNPEQRAKAAGDPGTSSGLQGYTGHYCSVPQPEEPGIVACSFVASGLRVFDIRDPLHPRELAYFNKPVSVNRPPDPPSSYAMSAPAFVPERGEIWYADGNSGFWALRFTNGVWPFDQPAAAGQPVDTPGPSRAAAGPGDGQVATIPATGSTQTVAAVGVALLALSLAVRRARARGRLA